MGFLSKSLNSRRCLGLQAYNVRKIRKYKLQECYWRRTPLMLQYHAPLALYFLAFDRSSFSPWVLYALIAYFFWPQFGQCRMFRPVSMYHFLIWDRLSFEPTFISLVCLQAPQHIFCVAVGMMWKSSFSDVLVLLIAIRREWPASLYTSCGSQIQTLLSRSLLFGIYHTEKTYW